MDIQKRFWTTKELSATHTIVQSDIGLACAWMRLNRVMRPVIHQHGIGYLPYLF